MTYLQALILGVVQGFTEFLPVSSSGHLVLFQHYLGLSEDMLSFDVFVHFGTLLAVLTVFRSTIISLVTGSVNDLRTAFSGKEPLLSVFRTSNDLRLIAAICIGTVPAVLVGLTMEDTIHGLFASVIPVLIALFFTGLFLLATFFARQGDQRIGPGKGLIIGFAQALAIIPGISRSGATITAALFLRTKRRDAGEFSFLLSIPVIAGATLLTVLDLLGEGVSGFTAGPQLAGMAASFLSGILSLTILMRIVRGGKLGWFGFYCLAVAAVGIILLSTGKLDAGSQSHMLKEDQLAETTITIPSSLDGVEQHIKYIRANGSSRPLLVALHTWSYGFEQDDVSSEYFERCRERDWNCVFPDFRGANNRPEACGSEAALTDILDAVAWARENLDVDPRRVFLVGCSGGGHMALLSAGHLPSTWTAVSAWVPISDLTRWHRETVEHELPYDEHLELSCGGAPGSSYEVDDEYRKRSPVTSLWRAHIIPVDINAGIHDGHAGRGGEGSVPVGQSIRAYNELVIAAGKKTETIPEFAIEAIERDEDVPVTLTGDVAVDSSYGRSIHLRRESGLSRLTLFEGGHEIIYDAVFTWLEKF